jgi:polyisoprenoid-binding protein YceI
VRAQAFFVAMVLLSVAGCASVPRAVPAPAAAPARAAPDDVELYRVDPTASSISAVATAVMGRYTFRFPRFEAAIAWSRSEVQRSRLTLEVDMRSVAGSIEMLTDIVRSADFLDVQRFPSARFDSTELLIDGGDRARVRGALTLHGVTRSIEVPGRFRFDGERLQLETEFRVDRREYGIENDGALDALVGDDVTVRLRLVATPVRANAHTRNADPERELLEPVGPAD